MNRKRNKKNRATAALTKQKGNALPPAELSPAEDSKSKFLAALHLGATVSEAAHWSGVSRATLYRWRQRDPRFAQAWIDSDKKLIQRLEFEAFKRAIGGSDRLLMFLLKAYDPYNFNEKHLAKALAVEERRGYLDSLRESLRHSIVEDEEVPPPLDVTSSSHKAPPDDPSGEAFSTEAVRQEEDSPDRAWRDHACVADANDSGNPATGLSLSHQRPSIYI